MSYRESFWIKKNVPHSIMSEGGPSLRPPPFIHTALRKFPKEIDDELWCTFRFSRDPIVYRPSSTPLPSDIDSGDETDENDHETRIRSSWHHRALLGDENRVLYTDFKDTDMDRPDATEDGDDGEPHST